jgi:hypothetical protein
VNISHLSVCSRDILGSSLKAPLTCRWALVVTVMRTLGWVSVLGSLS